LDDSADRENELCARGAGSLVVLAAVSRAGDQKSACTPIPIALR